jgi:hypothetical protein
MELWFLCTALPLNVLYHCMELYWLPTSGFQVILRIRKSNGEKTKDNNSVITLDRVMVLVHCISLTVLNHCMKLFEFKPVVFKLCPGQGKVKKGNNSVLNCQDGVLVLVHCTSSQCTRPLYEAVLNSNH